MSRSIIILGNGFDLDLGLKTSYSHFAESPQWKNLMDNNAHSLDGSWLLGFLKSKYDLVRWIDIESALLEYAVAKTKSHIMAYAPADAIDFKALCQALKTYLREQQDIFSPSVHSVASVFLKLLVSLSAQSSIYSFNYTDLNVLADKCSLTMNHTVNHIHGSLAVDDDIILGIETSDRIDDRYAFLYKTQNRNYAHTNILKDLHNKEEYVFFGHSLNGMDYEYFKNTFQNLSLVSGSNPSRLTIITKDEASENCFKSFLRRHISLQGLYSYSNPVFILTDLVYNKDKNEILKVCDLLERMKAM